MNAIIRLSVNRSKKAASCTTKTSQSQSPRSAGLSIVHFFQSAFHIVSACICLDAVPAYHAQANKTGRSDLKKVMLLLAALLWSHPVAAEPLPLSPSGVKTLAPEGAIKPTGTWSLGTRAGDFVYIP